MLMHYVLRMSETSTEAQAVRSDVSVSDGLSLSAVALCMPERM